MEGLIILLLCLAALVFVIWLWYLLCREFYRIAERKGFADTKYLWLTFWLGWIGMLLVVALPDRGVQNVAMPYASTAQQAPVDYEELPDL